jgi:flagellar motor protein MotB
MKYITGTSIKNNMKNRIRNSLAILVLSSFQTLLAEDIQTEEIIESPIHSTVCNEGKCAIVAKPGAVSNDAAIQGNGFGVPPNSEMLLPGETFTFWGLDEVINSTATDGKTVVVEKEISETTSVASKEQIDDVRFVSGKHYIADKFVEKLRDVLARLGHVNNLRVHFIGHTDSQGMSAKTRAIYGDNYGLGRSRAKRTAAFFQKRLNLAEKSISYEGKGPDEPIASNNTSEGMALNRRVEIQIWHDAVVKRKVAQERFIPATSGINRTQVCRQKNLCRRIEQSGKDKRVVLENAVAPIRYKSGRSIITDEYTKGLQNVVDSLKDKQGLQLMFVGHTDNQRLSARAQKIFINNQGLSMARAKRAADHFRGKLGLDEVAIIYDGRGYSEPVASNDAPQGMALNRRVEVEVSYLVPDTTRSGVSTGEIVQCPSGDLPANIKRIGGGYGTDQHSKENLYTEIPYSMTSGSMKAWRVSVDGNAIVNGQPRHGADVQRCVDVALEKAELQLQYDRMKAEPMLNLAAWPNVAVDGQIIYFRGWSNYPHWIKRAEVIIYTLGFENQKHIVQQIELNKGLENSWQVTDVSADKLWYSLRVYDDAGRYDETIAKSLFVADEYVDDASDDSLRETALRAGYGKNSLARQNIPIVGGTITANGIHVPQDKNVWIMGQSVPLDEKGSFVAQQIIPVGLHTAEVAVLDDNGNGELLSRDLELKTHDWFYVGLADITFSLNDTSGSTDLLTEDDLEDDSTDGRIAFYVKGKFKNKYTLTTSLDSREEPLDELFSNFHKKDPSSLLRRLDSEDHYPTFGDDSILYEDAPTQGKFYAKIEDGKSHALWGNFKVNIAENELAIINRGLYGGHVGFQSEAFTKSGNRRTRIDLFAAEPGTVPAFEEFRGTGGSLYYLRHGDITNGSEQLRIEVRDKDSGFVLSSTVMLAGQDYELDALQGIVLLTKPLNSTATGNDLVRSTANASVSLKPGTYS